MTTYKNFNIRVQSLWWWLGLKKRVEAVYKKDGKYLRLSVDYRFDESTDDMVAVIKRMIDDTHVMTKG